MADARVGAPAVVVGDAPLDVEGGAADTGPAAPGTLPLGLSNEQIAALRQALGVTGAGADQGGNLQAAAAGVQTDAQAASLRQISMGPGWYRETLAKDS